MFVFKFEKLLSIKEDMLKKCMIEIANIEATIKKYRKIKLQLEKENSKRKNNLNKILKGSLDKKMILFISENIAKTQIDIRFIEENIKKLQQEKTKKIEEAKMLNIEKKKLEKLKEKEYENHINKENKTETRFLDEIANIKSANGIINS